MPDVALQLYALAMWTVLELTLPIIVAVAVVGVVVSLVQTVVGVQDQNVSFGPKIAAAGVMMSLGFAPGLALLAHLLSVALASLPRLSG